jgi:WD40 repeat protein/nucleoside phosphorylase
MASTDVLHLMAEPTPEGPGVTRTEERAVDVLILTALEDELEAVLGLGEGWSERKDRGGFPYRQREFARDGGKRPLVVAAAWLGKMGEVATAIRGGALLDEIDPACVAMCGICAGMRGEVALGDVIVADRLYSYDEGKLIAELGKDPEFHHDIRTYELHPLLAMGASNLKRELDLVALQRQRPPSNDAQQRWLLHALHAHETEGAPTPVSLAERKTACPSWPHRIQEAIANKLLILDGGVISLTNEGRKLVLDEHTLYPDTLPEDPDLQVHVGAVGTGKAVQKDPALFTRLRRVVRTTIGVEMEGAAIGELAKYFNKRGIVVKAVSDHADFKKDDSFRKFACRASAEVLMAFLLKHLDPERGPVKSRHADDAQRFEPSSPRNRSDEFLDRVQRVALLRDPSATVTRYPAKTPFAGVLELAICDGALVDLRIIAAIEQPITEALVAQYQIEVELPFRQQDPLLRSTLIYGGAPASPEFARDVARRGVVLKSFGEYQRLIDFGPYVAKQTGRLDIDPIYPPSLYVEQPARWSLAGGREEQVTEHALATLWDLLDASHPRFALVLGDFGAGKTFLLHELARRMTTNKHPLVPVLVEMRKLEKQTSLKALLAQHFANADVEPINLNAFQYMLSEGRIALLFDGFDELALRLTYDRALEHFETVMMAAQGLAKVVVTSRTQHFLTDHQVRRALAERAEQVPGYRLLQLEKFGEKQIRRFLDNIISSPEEAKDRYRLLDEVKDLLGLSENPRMLAFIAKIAPDKLREAKKTSGEITAAKLYEILIGQWLDFEFARVNPQGAPKGISRSALDSLVRHLAAVFWERNAKTLAISEFREMMVAEGIEPAVVEHMIGSGSLLVRDQEGQFSFVHQSVMEWLVANAAAQEITGTGTAMVLGLDEMSKLMADFLISLAGREKAETWANSVLMNGTAGHFKANALKVMSRVVSNVEKPAQELDLAGQDLRGQDLSGRDFRRANLERADLRGASLGGLDLREANLVGVQFQRADLSAVRFENADLSSADLSFARLLGADLRHVKLDGANLRAAKFVGAKLDEGWTSSLCAAGAAPPAPKLIELMMLTMAECAAVTWSPQSDLLIAGGQDGLIRIWDRATGQMIRTLPGHTAAILGVAVSADGTRLVSGSEDGAVRLWELASGRAICALPTDKESIQSIAVSLDGETVALGMAKGSVELWEFAGKRKILGIKSHALSLAFSRDGKDLAVGETTGDVRLWDVQSGSLLYEFKGAQGPVASIALSLDGKILAMGAEDRTIRLVDISSGRIIGPLRGHREKVASVAVSPDGALLASGSYDSTIQIWDITSGRSVRTLKGHKGIVLSVAFSPDGSLLASSSGDQTLRLWDTSAVRREDASEGTAVVGPRIWLHAEFGRALLTLKARSDMATSVAVSPDGAMLAVGANDAKIRLMDIASGRMLCLIKVHTDAVDSVAFSPDSKTLASGSRDSSIRLWDIVTGSISRNFKNQSSPVLSVAFHSDGNTLATMTGEGTLKYWNISSGRSTKTVKGIDGKSIAINPNNGTVAIGSFGWITLWDETADKVNRLAMPVHWVPRLAFSTDGSILIAALGDGTIQILDTSSATTLRSFKIAYRMPQSIALSPDGNWLAVGSNDSAVRLFDLATGALLAILLPCPEGWAAFTPDGRYKLGGDIAGSFWHVIGLCRFEPGELDPYLPHLRVPDDQPLIVLPTAR